MDWAEGIAETARAYSDTAFGVAEAQVKPTEKSYQRVFGRLFSAIYYHARRPLYLGDKLEILVIKR